MSLSHPEPEVRQLAMAMAYDDDIEFIVLTACRANGCATLADLFAAKPDLVFELHEEIMLMLQQLDPESDDFAACDLAIPDPPDEEAWRGSPT